MITPSEILDLPTLTQNPREYVVLLQGRPMVFYASLAGYLTGQGPVASRGRMERRTLTAREYKDAVSAGMRMIVLELR